MSCMLHKTLNEYSLSGVKLYTVSQKNKTLYISPYLYKLLTDFQNLFTENSSVNLQ